MDCSAYANSVDILRSQEKRIFRFFSCAAFVFLFYISVKCIKLHLQFMLLLQYAISHDLQLIDDNNRDNCNTCTK